MREWTDPWNPFNSTKTLMWREHFEGIAKQDFIAPVTSDIDPSNRCNYNCLWCNAFDYMSRGDHMLEKDHMIWLAALHKAWGIKSTCVAGGGEPLTNPHFCDLLEALHKNGIQIGVITNGSLMGDRERKTIAATCRWCGISMDAGTDETYNRVKGRGGRGKFPLVLDHIRKLVREIDAAGTGCQVAYKYLLHPLNAREIFQAAGIAKAIGADHFHLRPVGWDNLTKTKGSNITFDGLIEEINDQLARAMQIETDHFKVFGIRHKFKPNLSRKVNFSRCWAPPLLVTFGADGNCHLCFDMRGRPDLIMCRHEEVLSFWNSPQHKKMIADVDIRHCPRCTFGPYNEIVEKVFIEDRMCRNFP